MESEDQELHQLGEQTGDVHRTINRSNKLTAVLYNVQQALTALKVQAKIRWLSLCDMLNSHNKASLEIRAVAGQYPDKVSNATVSNAYLRKIRKHTAYLNIIKTTCAELQTRQHTLSECQADCECLSDLVEEGKGEAGNEFQHCKLECDKFLVGNQYDSGKSKVDI